MVASSVWAEFFGGPHDGATLQLRTTPEVYRFPVAQSLSFMQVVEGEATLMEQEVTTYRRERDSRGIAVGPVRYVYEKPPGSPLGATGSASDGS